MKLNPLRKYTVLEIKLTQAVSTQFEAYSASHTRQEFSRPSPWNYAIGTRFKLIISLKDNFIEIDLEYSYNSKLIYKILVAIS